ncbi:MAG: zinc ABC transporter ATP-binding protein ZnuC [SAR324 cluster bacterium]|nr:zinc ABC transporter ATP-binding protein ZnuC [SAR324 cluster bacterium]
MSANAEGRALIEAREVSVRLGKREVLESVDVRVNPGEIVTLVGPNGAGKTTLVRVLLGIVKPASGRVLRREGLSVGYVPQRLQVDQTLPLTVRRFLTTGHGSDANAISHSLAEVGAGHLDDTFLHDLSGGEFRRVLLARGLLRNPGLLILDEPVSGVDITGQFALYDLISRIRKERGCGVLLISHDLHIVMASTDRVICLNRHICCSGHPESVMRDPAYVGLFGERASQGLAVYAHSHDHSHEPEIVEGAQNR